MLDKKQLKQLNLLYEKMSSSQQEDFMKKNGLIAVFKDDIIRRLSALERKPQQKNFFKKLGNCTKEEVDDFINQVEFKILKEKYKIVLSIEDIIYSNVIGQSRLFKVIDSTSFDSFLILSKTENPKRNIKLYEERVKQMFDASDLYSFDHTICKTLLPKMIMKFRDNVHGHPSELTEREWRDIILQLAWYMNEICYAVDEFCDKTEQENKLYYEKMEESQQLLGKYFNHLWD